MKTSKLTRILALVLVLALTVFSPLTAGAANVVGDLNGDGKITVFDAQLLLEATAGLRELDIAGGITVKSIVDYVLGKVTLDAGDMDGDGVVEIYTSTGLQVLRDDPAGSYILMNDLDLDGAAWTPVSGFSGSLDFNGYSISDLVISSNSIKNLGFFGDTTATAVITDLELYDITVNASSNSQFIGLVAGINRGTIENCTVTGIINDSRSSTATGGKIYVGGLVGSATSGSVTGSSALSATDSLGKASVSGLCGEIALNINHYSSAVVNGGLYGRLLSGATVTGTWCDTSFSSTLQSEVIQARRDKVVDYMTAMASVKWTPSENMTYTATNGTDQSYTAGVVYTGLPYNGHNGSLERFLSVMDSHNANGVYTTQTGLGSCGWQSSAQEVRYIRVYQTQNAYTGRIYGSVTRSSTAPSEVFTFDAEENTLLYTKDGTTYYLGGNDSNTNLHVTSELSQYPVHLYTIVGGDPIMVTAPAAGTTYKLGIQTDDGTVMFFDGESVTSGTTACLSTTAEIHDALNVYVSTADGGYQLYYYIEGAWSEDGFYLYMGNDCSGAVNWAWMQVTNTMTTDVSTHATPYKGGTYVLTTNYMVPNNTNRDAKGIYQVGQWTPSQINSSGKWVGNAFDSSKVAYQCTDETYTGEVLNSNGMEAILNAYGQTRKGDAVVTYVEKWSSRVDIGGHARLVAADPMVIRYADNTVDPDLSYMYLTEQGVGFGTKSTWNIEKKHTFRTLTAADANGVCTTSSKTYLPITIRALNEDNIRDIYLIEVLSETDPTKNFPILSPAEGRLYSYHHINSVAVTVTDSEGNVYYDHEAFTGIGTVYNTYRGRNNDHYMADLHGETFYAAAQANGMVEGQEYIFDVNVRISTGDVIELVSDRTFTYTAPTAE